MLKPISVLSKKPDVCIAYRGRLEIKPTDAPIKNSLPAMIKRYVQLPSSRAGTVTFTIGVTMMASITESQNFTGFGILGSIKTEAVNIMARKRRLTMKCINMRLTVGSSVIKGDNACQPL